jgi:DMSO reductase family type II enzyme chaperone
MAATSNAGRPALSTTATLARAALFRLLADGFGYPTPGHSAGMRMSLFRLGRAVRENLFVPAVAGALSALRLAWGTAADTALSTEYLRLFSANGVVSLHESAYGDGRRIAGRPVELADIAGFYLAFGVSASDSAPDLPDHASAELEFMSLLLLKESHSVTQGWPGKTCIVQDAAKDFLESHLGRWIDALVREVDRAGASPPYRTLARLARAAVAVECRRLDVHPRVAAGRLPFDTMQADSLACPMSPAEALTR